MQFFFNNNSSDRAINYFRRFLIKTLNTLEKSQLIQMAIDKINGTGAVLTSTAFDGLKTNFFACEEQLGASFNIDQFKPFLIDSANK